MVADAAALISGDIGGEDEGQDPGDERQTQAVLPDVDHIGSERSVIGVVLLLEQIKIAVAEGGTAATIFEPRTKISTASLPETVLSA